MTPEETELDFPVSVQESLAEVWVDSGLPQGQGRPAAGLGALSAAVPAWGLLKEITIIFITSTVACPRSNNREETQPCPLTENWTKDLLSMALHIRKRPSFPLSQFSSVQLLSRVQLFATPWTAACQASLSITNS